MQDDLITYYDKGLQQLRQEIEAYSNEADMWKVAGTISNSGGNLCFHLVGNLNHFIGAALGNTGYMRDRPREFNIEGVPREALLRYIEETRRMIWGTLRNIEDLQAPYPEGYRDWHSTIGAELLRLLGHLNYHVGQINYHRRLLAS